MSHSTTSIRFRFATPEDQAFLEEILYQSIHVPEGTEPLPRSVVSAPELARYVAGWGRAGDIAIVALVGDEPAGAAWMRLMTGKERGYGWVSDETPELGIALLPQYRGRGIGTKLMYELLDRARDRYTAVSLSVSDDNRAMKMYERMGFETVLLENGSATMELKLDDAPQRLTDAALIGEWNWTGTDADDTEATRLFFHPDHMGLVVHRGEKVATFIWEIASDGWDLSISRMSVIEEGAPDASTLAPAGCSLRFPTLDFERFSLPFGMRQFAKRV